MRICISTTQLGELGGAQRVIVADARYFAEQGHEVHIVATDFDRVVLSEYGLPDSVTTHEYESGHWSAIGDVAIQARAIRGILQGIAPDGVLAHYRERATWLALLTLPIDPVFATHVHGSLFWLPHSNERIAHNWRPRIREVIQEVPGHAEFWTDDDQSVFGKTDMIGSELIEAAALHSCDTVFVNTQQVKEELRALYRVNATVNPPGSNVADPANPTEIDLPTSNPFIFSISRLDKRKRIGLLIDAFAELRSVRSDIDLVVGGSGEEGERLRRLATENGVEDMVHFVGFIEERDVPAYYRAAEVFACPGWMSYGLTPIEAVGLRTKLAISSDAFAKEVVGDRSGVAVLPPGAGAWASGLDRLLSTDAVPSGTGLPTPENHSQTKLEVFESATD